MKIKKLLFIILLSLFVITSANAAKPGIGPFYGTYRGYVNGFAQELSSLQQRPFNSSFSLTLFRTVISSGGSGAFVSPIPSYDGRRSYFPASSRLTYDKKRNRLIGFAEYVGTFQNPRTRVIESAYGTVQTRTVNIAGRKKTFITITLTEGSYVYYTVSGVLYK